MAARLAPDSVQPMRQSLHHLVAKAPWSDERLLEEVLKQVLPAMQKQGPVVAWIVDDAGFPKKGKHSVGVAHQYCGQLGKQENCRVAVSLSVSTWSSSLPIAYRLYLPKEWAEDAERREKVEVPEEIQFQTKPDIAMDQIRAAVAAEVVRGIVLADAASKGPTGQASACESANGFAESRPASASPEHTAPSTSATLFFGTTWAPLRNCAAIRASLLSRVATASFWPRTCSLSRIGADSGKINS